MANAERLIALSMVPVLATEVAKQVNDTSAGAVPAKIVTATASPAPYSTTAADLAAALVAAGLMAAA